MEGCSDFTTSQQPYGRLTLRAIHSRRSCPHAHGVLIAQLQGTVRLASVIPYSVPNAQRGIPFMAPEEFARQAKSAHPVTRPKQPKPTLSNTQPGYVQTSGGLPQPQFAGFHQGTEYCECTMR